MIGRSTCTLWLLPASAALTVFGIVMLSISLELAPVPRRAAVLPGLTARDCGEGGGIIITSVQSDSSAARAGISVGDRITTINGHAVRGVAAVQSYLDHDKRPILDLYLYHYHAPRTVRLVRSEEPQHVAQDSGRRG